MKIINGGITKVNGISALGKHIGIKRKRKDFGVIYSDVVCSAAGMFTKNQVKGAPLYVSMEHLKNGKAQAIVINSGVANVATGRQGLKDAEMMATLVGKELSIKKDDVLVASTGVIGKFLPMKIIEKGTKGIKKQLNKTDEISEAILTTDTKVKQIALKFGKSGKFTIGAVAKGSGMIHPNMATMLCFIGTDAKIPSAKLKKMLKSSVDKSFNMISVDMDTSTSDSVMVLANGLAGSLNKAEEKEFQTALDFVCLTLAKKIAEDGEGATKLIIAKVINAKTDEDAKKIAKGLVTSNLLKCAIFGSDPNWGRIMSAIGNSQGHFVESKLEVFINNQRIAKKGFATNFDASKIRHILHSKEIELKVDLHLGKASAQAYGCDMTYEYVKINAAYHT